MVKIVLANPAPPDIPVVPLLAEKSVSGGMSGSPSDMRVMFDFCVRHGIKPLMGNQRRVGNLRAHPFRPRPDG